MQYVSFHGEALGVLTILLYIECRLSLLVKRFVPTKAIRVHNKDKPWFNDDCRRVFELKQETDLRWTLDRSRDNWDKFVNY